MTIDIAQARPPGLPRRLAAMLYDGLLLLGVLFVAVALVVIPYEQVLGSPFPNQDPLARLILQGYLLLVSGLYFTYFWIRGGQTLGMRAWRLRVLREDGEPLRWRDAWVRFLASLLSLVPAGLGFAWILIDRERFAWHDRLSRTRLVILAKR
ncbi:RDD family protein [Thiococcus pfennigii]|jgi:uncharacterized RDD family membrane protein YckC|uniref:RDD family protein n=1 Tax=Thiococcus pfennigii TaxID=1057 RepID=UPI0019070B2A|nr:RDD family protein [Thiococcus pfennigii]MBK1701741.1 RDD family protein [Thiococcus pfennigii]